MSNRYDALRQRIARDFSRSATLTPEFAAGEAKTLVNLDDHSDTFALSDRFEKYGPFNAVIVRNFSGSDVTVYVNAERTAFATVPSGANRAVRVLTRLPTRYVRYLRVENEDGANAISAGDVEIHVGNEVDSVELDLLKMAGQLDVQG